MCRDYPVECILSRMRSDKGDVVLWMPVSRGALESEREGEEGVDCRDDVTALGDGQRAGLHGLERSTGWVFTGGQKSFCMSTTRRAHLVGSKVVIAGG